MFGIKTEVNTVKAQKTERFIVHHGRDTVRNRCAEQAAESGVSSNDLISHENPPDK